MSYEIKDSRFPFCVLRAVVEDNYVTIELKGSTLLIEHQILIDSIMDERLSTPYSIDYNASTNHLQLTYW